MYGGHFPADVDLANNLAGLAPRAHEESTVLLKRACPLSTDVDCGDGLCCSEGDTCIPTDGTAGYLCGPDPKGFSASGFQSVSTAFPAITPTASSVNNIASSTSSVPNSLSTEVSQSTTSTSPSVSSTSSASSASASSTAVPVLGPKPHHGLSGGAIAGIVVGVLAGVGLLGVFVFFLVWLLRKRKAEAEARQKRNSRTAHTDLNKGVGFGGTPTHTATASGGP